jgi:hypothetical protein
LTGKRARRPQRQRRQAQRHDFEALDALTDAAGHSAQGIAAAARMGSDAGQRSAF